MFMKLSVFLLVLLAACGDSRILDPNGSVPRVNPGAGDVTLRVLSNRADLLSSGDVLVELLLASGTELSTIKVDVDGRDVTSAFARRADGRNLGVVQGLVVGNNQLRARLSNGSGAAITLTNHPRGGPIFTGKQIQPWICDTVGNGLGPALDVQCNAPSSFALMYKSAATQMFAAYNPASPPSDLASTTTDAGKTVPYIVRVETGALNRGSYKIAVLFDPTETPAPWSPPKAWNGKLVFLFGGGSAPHHYQDKSPNPLDDNALRNGFMVVTSSLNVHGSNTNDNVSAETVMMIKEQIIENYGEIRYTIGEGCSGGALQQYMIAAQYPGLLDGLIPTCSYPDLYTPSSEVFACVLMNRYFTKTSPQLWAAVSQQAEVMGHSSIGPCQTWEAFFGARLDPKVAANCKLPADQVYDPATNPEGARCSFPDYMVSIMGQRDPSVWGPVEKRIGRGFGNRLVSNVGLQFGLTALKANLILAEQFADLNEKIGGIDIDGEFVAERIKADPGSAAFAHRGGLITDARQLAKVPIIDLRGHDDQEIHTDSWTYVLRARLDRHLGNHDNMIIFTGATPLTGDTAFSCSSGISAGFGAQPVPSTPYELCTHNPLLLMARWLDAIKADTSKDALATKVVRNKPTNAVDTCFISGAPVTDPAACAAAYPYFSNPMVQAGAPFTNDNFECQLKPVVRADYAGITPALSDAQFVRLQAVFPTGVCDWSKPSASDQPSLPWLDYSAGPYGKPIGEAPVARALR